MLYRILIMQPKKVLIIGLGKFGSIKADVYSKMGCIVDALDPYNDDTKCLTRHCYKDVSDIRLGYDIYEICVPTQRHCEYITRLAINDPNVTIVCEKPLASNFRDLALTISTAGRNFNTNYVYSENYAASSLVHKAKSLIEKYKLVPLKAIIEFSKDRRDDIAKGRFVDTDLEGFGIELPHMLTALQILGLGFDTIVSALTTDLVCEDKTYLRQGNISVKGYSQNRVSLEMYQSLDGKINFFHPRFAFDTSYISPYRILYLQCTNGYELFAQFEPVFGQGRRYVGKLELVKGAEIVVSQPINDMPLNHLIQIIVDGSFSRKWYHEFLTFQHGAEVTGTLVGLQKHSLMEI